MINNNSNGHNIESTEECWLSNGTMGDSSCQLLEDYVICQNCPDYISSGRKLFNRIVPSKLLDEWTISLAREKEIEQQGNANVVVFRIENEWLSLKTIYFQGIVENREIHTIPFRTNKFFKGIVNVNGELLLCLSLKNIIGIETEQKTEGSAPERSIKRMIVVSKDSERFVIPVEEVLGVIRFSLEDMQNIPATHTKYPKSLVSGIYEFDGRTIGMLNEDKFFDSLKIGLQR